MGLLAGLLRASAAHLRRLARRLRRPQPAPVIAAGWRVCHWTGEYAGVVVRTEQRVADFLTRIAPTGRDQWQDSLAMAETFAPHDGQLVAVCADAPAWPLGVEILARPEDLVVLDRRDCRAIN